MAEKDVDKVIAGKMGFNMKQALKEKGVEFEEKTGKIEEVL